MIDELAVAQVAEDGYRLRLRGQDLKAAVLAMYGRVSVENMAWRLMCTSRTVERTRAELGLS